MKDYALLVRDQLYYHEKIILLNYNKYQKRIFFLIY